MGGSRKVEPQEFPTLHQECLEGHDCSLFSGVQGASKMGKIPISRLFRPGMRRLNLASKYANLCLQEEIALSSF